MAAGRIIVPGWMPALDQDGEPIPNARMYFYQNQTTSLAVVYTDATLTTPLPNPVAANSSGQFPAIWADDANLFSVTIDAPFGPPGQPFTYDDLGPSTSANADAKNKLDRNGLNAEPAFLDNIGDVRSKPFAYQGPFKFKTLGNNTPAPGTYIGTGGNSLSFQTLISYPEGGAEDDNQRASLLVVADTTDDGNSEEQTVCLLTTIKTGYATQFQPNTAYALGANFIGGPARAVYRVTSAGTSGATPPSGRTTGIVNGSMVVDWINDAAINAKLALYNEVVCEPGGGSAWAHVNNFELSPGYAADFACATEIDLTNNTGFDSEIGGKNKYGLWVACQGRNRSTAGIQVSSANTSKDALFWGLYFAGSRLATNAVICLDASSAIGIGAGVGAGGVAIPTFTTAFIRDRSISPTGASFAGTYSSAQIDLPQGGGAPAAISISGTKTFSAYIDTSTTPKAISLEGTNSVSAIEVSAITPASFVSAGTKSISGFQDASTAPFGFNAVGTYSVAPFQSTNFQVLPDGSVVAQSLRFGSLPVNAADDAAAAAGGVAFGGVYRTGNVLKVRVT